MKSARQQVVIAGTPQECFDAITDYETYPEWQAAVKRCEVLSTNEDGRGREVRTTIDAKVKEVSYTLLYSYEPPHLITWDYVEGDVKEIAGEMVFEDQGDGTTLATYSLRIDPGVWLPPGVAGLLRAEVMRRAVEDLKRRVEQRC